MNFAAIFIAAIASIALSPSAFAAPKEGKLCRDAYGATERKKNQVAVIKDKKKNIFNVQNAELERAVEQLLFTASQDLAAGRSVVRTEVARVDMILKRNSQENPYLKERLGKTSGTAVTTTITDLAKIMDTIRPSTLGWVSRMARRKSKSMVENFKSVETVIQDRLTSLADQAGVVRKDMSFLEREVDKIYGRLVELDAEISKMTTMTKAIDEHIDRHEIADAEKENMRVAILYPLTARIKELVESHNVLSVTRVKFQQGILLGQETVQQANSTLRQAAQLLPSLVASEVTSANAANLATATQGFNKAMQALLQSSGQTHLETVNNVSRTASEGTITEASLGNFAIAVKQAGDRLNSYQQEQLQIMQGQIARFEEARDQTVATISAFEKNLDSKLLPPIQRQYENRFVIDATAREIREGEKVLVERENPSGVN